MSERRSRIPAGSFSHRPTSSRRQSSSSQAPLPHSRNPFRRESARAQSSNDEDPPHIFVQSEARPPLSQRTASAPTASSCPSLMRAVRSMFTSKPMSEVQESRLPTGRALLLENGRTIFDGFALPSNMQSTHHPTITRHSDSDPPISSRRNNHEPRAFPANERATSRIKTEQAHLLDIQRTHYDGLAVPSDLRSVHPPTAAPSADRRPSSDGRLGGSLRPGASRPPSSVMPSSGGGYRSNVEPTSRPNSEARSSGSGRPSAKPGSNGTPRSNTAPSMQMNGLLPIQENDREDEHRSRGANPSLIMNPPTHVGSILRTPEDQAMASKQTRITTMSPAERSRQESWAQSILRQQPHFCPQGKEFKRIENPPGYRCEGGGHCIPDEVLAQGRGGICIVPGAKINKMSPLWGPYYEGPARDGSLVHGGDPNQPAPSFIEVGGTYKNDNAWKLHPDLSGPPTRQSEVDRVNREYENSKVHAKGP